MAKNDLRGTRMAIFRVIEDCAEGGLPLPSNQEIGKAVGLGTADWVSKHIAALAAEGLIRFLSASRVNRRVEIVATGKQTAAQARREPPKGFKLYSMRRTPARGEAVGEGHEAEKIIRLEHRPGCPVPVKILAPRTAHAETFPQRLSSGRR